MTEDAIADAAREIAARPVPVQETVIEVTDLSKRFRIGSERRDSLKERFVRGRGRYDEFWALREVTMSVPRGSTFGLIGHNGSGKSTLLKMLASIYRPTSGEISVRGRVSALLELGAGFHGELTGRENIYLNGAILGMTRKQIDAAMDQIIDFSGLEEFIDSPVKIYSSGMYVRLGFSIAVAVDPEILIVDEIIAVGDEEFQRKCFDYLYELRRQGTTIVLVSHSLGIVADLCDHALWLDHGRVKATGTARDVIDRYLEAVNQKEADTRARATGSGSSADGGMSSRIGSGEIRITGLELLDHNGTAASFLTTGEKCTIRLHYEAAQDLPAVTFGLGFTHESGVNVAGPNSGYGNAAKAVHAGAGVVDFEIDALILQPSLFRVSTAAVDRGHTYDYRDRAFELRVRALEAVTEPGLVQMPGRWVRGGAAQDLDRERDDS